MANKQNPIEILNQKVTDAYSKILNLKKDLEAAKKTNTELTSENQKLQKEIESLKAEKKKANA